MNDSAASAAPSPRLASALHCSRRGWQVLPIYEIGPDGRCACGGQPKCKPGKHPRTPHGFYDATTEETRIVEWWTRWPNANVAIRTGAGNGVLDEDPRNGGDETRVALEREYGALPDTVRAKTGGGGAHYFFRYPLHLGIQSREIGPGFEIKAEGGYVLVHESNHVSGGFYAWDAGAHPDETSVAPMPKWILQRLQAQRPQRRRQQRTRIRDDDFPPAHLAKIEEGCAWLRHCRDDAARGTGHDPLRVSEPEWF